MSLGHGPSIISNGLVLNIDAGNIKCYPGTGNTITDISAGKTNFSLYDTSGYVSPDGIFRFVYQANGTASNWITTSTFNAIPSGNVNNFSYCGFYKVTDTGSNKLWTFDNFGDDTNYRINYYPSYLTASMEINNTSQTYPTLPSMSSLNQWVYYALTIENTGLTYNLYRWNPSSSSLQSNSAVVTIPGTIGTNITFGRRGYITNNYCGVDMGIQMMYNRTLTSAELLQNFQALRGRYGL